tara:strand:- start:114 stop:734 length:621 start_codon:yes stop_codon:yes gene_type:complete
MKKEDIGYPNPIQETLQKRAIGFEAFVRKTRDYYKNIIKGFQETVYQAERELREMGDKNSHLHDQLVQAVEDIIDDRAERYPSVIGENVFRKRGVRFLDESHKDYEDDKESIHGLYEGYGLRIPDGFLSEKEAEDRMEDEYDRSRCEAADFYRDDFDFFRCRIHPAYYKTDKVWKEELATIEEEKQRTKEAEQTLARLKERDNEKS